MGRRSIGASIIAAAMSTVGQRVKLARKAAGLSQQQLAEKIGVTQPTIAELEKGDSKSSKYVVEIALACDVSPRWLAKNEGDRQLTMNDLLAEFATLPRTAQLEALTIAKALEQRRGK